ncbi:hypothetical protein A7A08_02050 [Methyloligella halotolerans]|uniref:Uncharacterized protein n=1 Tax=Methyloligella halotolerans TaxID=1177755 RepID=A0A1E2RYK0_9HYPH|nr:hypothetical protein [Methyloligella halotolerans]ODA67303.1 hypothetical protein A7A08_02050 [Methyloligella halotolerans]
MYRTLSINESVAGLADDDHKEAALSYILDAWEEALLDGIEPEMLANAALFAAFADLISIYGEDAVAKMAGNLSRRVTNGEFTVKRNTH